MTTKKTTTGKKPAAKKVAAPKKTAPLAIEASGDTAIANADLVIANEAKQSSNETERETEQPLANNDSQQESQYAIRNAQYAVIIPYLKSEAAGDELRYALRSWDQNFREDFRVIVIGDREDWFSPDIVHIPHDPHLVLEDCACPAPSMIRNPQADINHKLFTAITAESLTGEVIYTNDDIFLLAATHMPDLQVLKSFKEDLIESSTRDTLYAKNNRATAKRLQEQGLPVTRYGTHMPMVFDAEKLIDVIEKYEALDHGYPIESLYFNELYPDARPIKISGDRTGQILGSAYRHDIDPKAIEEVFATRKFLNCNNKGWFAILPQLEKHFPTPSRFEK